MMNQDTLSRSKTSSKKSFLPYGRQNITAADIEAVFEVLQSDYLTQGPVVQQFESALCTALKAREAVVCSSATAALHLAMMALDIKPGDAVITTPNTFLADANCIRYVGAEVKFADIDIATGNIDLNAVEKLLKADLKHQIKAIIPVHFAGLPVNLAALKQLCDPYHVRIVDDACHAIGSNVYANGEVVLTGENRWSDMTIFSFHPVKHVATGEGGAITTSNHELAERLRRLRSHGINRETFENRELAHDKSDSVNPWYYEMSEIGFNYRLTDIQSALGMSQVKRLLESVKRRNEIARRYRALIAEYFESSQVKPLAIREDVTHAYHLFVVQIDFQSLGVSRAKVMNSLKEAGIGTQVHYIPIHLQPYYQRVTGTHKGLCPQAELYYERALSLPMYPELTDSDISHVVASLSSALGLS